MNVVIAGGHGRVALRLARRLRERGDHVRSLIRKPAHAADVEVAAAKANAIERYVMLSSRGADPDAAGDDTFAVYLRAKGKADAELRASGLADTIVRPGWLTDDRGTGRISAAEHVEEGRISRDDVAAVLAFAVHDPDLAGVTFEVVEGDTPIEQALAACATARENIA
jgi:uncharacterized protein YbjT (DUF2867 family)